MDHQLEAWLQVTSSSQKGLPGRKRWTWISVLPWWVRALQSVQWPNLARKKVR